VTWPVANLRSRLRRMAATVGGRNQAEDIAQEAFARALIPAAAERHAERVGIGRVVRQRPL